MEGELSRATMSFERSPNWRIAEYDATIAMKNYGSGLPHQYERHAKYAWSEGGAATLVRVVVDYDGVPAIQSPAGKATFELSQLTREKVPDSRFRLTHYGLPEPNLSSDRHRLKITLGILVAGAVLLLIAKRFLPNTA